MSPILARGFQPGPISLAMMTALVRAHVFLHNNGGSTDNQNSLFGSLIVHSLAARASQIAAISHDCGLPICPQ